MNSSLKTMVLSGLVAFGWSMGAAAGDRDVEMAVLPGADLAARLNVQKLLATSFSQELMKEDPAKPVKQNRELAKFNDFCKQLGLVPADIGNIVLTVDFDVPPERKVEVGDNLFMVGIESAKPWDLKKLAAAVAKLDEKPVKEGEAAKPEETAGKLVFETLTIEGVAVLKISPAKKADPEAEPEHKKKKGPDDSYLAVSADGKVLLLTQFEPEMKQALVRLKEQRPVELEAKLKALCGPLTANIPFSGGFVLTEKMKDKLQAAPGPEAAGGGMNPMSGIQDAFRSLQQVGWSLKVDKDAALVVKTGLGSVNDAAKGATAINGFIAMARGMLAMGEADAEPEAKLMTSLFDSLRIANADQDVVVDVLFSAEWAGKVKEAIAKKAAEEAAPPIPAAGE